VRIPQPIPGLVIRVDHGIPPPRFFDEVSVPRSGEAAACKTRAARLTVFSALLPTLAYLDI